MALTQEQLNRILGKESVVQRAFNENRPAVTNTPRNIVSGTYADLLKPLTNNLVGDIVLGDVQRGLNSASYGQPLTTGGSVQTGGFRPEYLALALGLTPMGKGAKVAKKTEYEIAQQTAQRNAALPVSEGGLGLPKSNTAMDRANAMGAQDVYHGTKQDITGGFQPVYSDNLTFTTPNPQFASDWIGKGAKQQRIGDVAEKERQQAYQEYKDIRNKNMDSNSLNKLEGDAFKNEYDKRLAVMNKELAKAGLSRMDNSIHGNILPLKAMVKKTFNPSQDYKLMNDYIKSAFPNETPNGNVLDMFKNGDYIVYETPKAVEYLKNLGYDSMMLRESASQPNSTLAIFNPSDVRSRFAAFDPFRRNEADILAGVGVGVPTAGLLDEKKRK